MNDRQNGPLLNALGEDIWEVNAPLKLMGCLELGHRMTVTRYGKDDLLIHSPVRFSSELGAALSELGSPRFIVAPSVFHDLYLNDWTRHYPEAPLLAVSGLPKRRGTVAGPLPADWPPAVAEHVQIAQVEGMPRVNENVLFHRASGSLIVADLVFNLGRDSSPVSTLLLKLMGSYRHLGPSRLFKSFIKDQRAFGESLERILEWDFDRLVVGHGDVVETGGKDALRRAFEGP